MAFVLQEDEDRGGYCREDAIYRDKGTKMYKYCYATHLTNAGYITYSSWDKANAGLQILMESARKVKLNKTWHIEEVDIIKVSIAECKKGKIPKLPFVIEEIN